MENKKRLIIIGAGVLALLLVLAVVAAMISANSTEEEPVVVKKDTLELLELDPDKDYGNKYEDGILPVGDGKFKTSEAKKGYIYACQDNYGEDAPGAQERGPWFSENGKTWDVNKKSTVDGFINWKNELLISDSDGKRKIKTNALPSHHTGKFPVEADDDAYEFDRNPNFIREQELTYEITLNPKAGKPQCMGNEVGVMITGVPLFNAFDAGGRDAGAWEVQDTCDGHPQVQGQYHYHTLSRCISDVSVSTVIGWALDGFPITGPKVGENNLLTTSDLDECHGIVSEVLIEGKKVKTYHYVMTQDFPYSVSCFRADAIDPPRVGEEPGGIGGTTRPASSSSAPPSSGPPPSSTPPPSSSRP